MTPPPSLLLGTEAPELFLSDFGLEGRQKKNFINSALKNHCLWRDCSTSCSVPVGLPSAEPHAEITVFRLFRKAIEKQTSVSQCLCLHFGSPCFVFFFQMGKTPVFKTSIALPMGSQSLQVAQVHAHVYVQLLFPQNPCGRVDFFCWKWHIKARHLSLSFPSKSGSGQQPFSPYRGQHPHPTQSMP